MNEKLAKGLRNVLKAHGLDVNQAFYIEVEHKSRSVVTGLNMDGTPKTIVIPTTQRVLDECGRQKYQDHKRIASESL
jgi:SOS response regulatory protein OraA/RecX